MFSESYQTHEGYPNDAYFAAREHDPLQLDNTLATLPELNANGDVEAITSITKNAIDTFPQNLNEAESVAALRDLDFLVSSLIRHGLEPIEIIDNLDEKLQNIAIVTNSVPRGSVSTYTNANPSGARMRTFTGTPAEKVFIEAVTTSSRALDTAMYAFGASGYDRGLQQTKIALDTMISSILVVKKEVSPSFFTNILRPYFDSMTVNGQRYLGSGGAQLQLVGIDYLLWGVSDVDQVYRNFFVENFAYLTPNQRDSVESALALYGNMSVIDYLTTFEDPAMAQDAIDCMRKIRKFRFPHRKVAVDNFKLRPSGSVGSGSYTPEILNLLIEKNDEAMHAIGRKYGL